MLLFGAVALGVGMHHLVATGTCSSTGYSSHYGPVPYCPKGTGWWIAKLRDRGALTEDEFNRQKAKLLAEL